MMDTPLPPNLLEVNNSRAPVFDSIVNGRIAHATEAMKAEHDARVTDLLTANVRLTNERREATRQAEFNLNLAQSYKVELDALKAKINTPELLDFMAGILLESAHARERWAEEDKHKSHLEWYGTVGLLLGKAISAACNRETDKLLHHLITAAGAIANWHRAVVISKQEKDAAQAEREAFVASLAGEGDSA
jgi:hypothetical protein